MHRVNREWVEFRIKVQPSPETNDFEVYLLGGGQNLINRFQDDLMGLDPDDLLLEPCPLRAQESPHTAVIGRCYCGEIGCGNLEVEIRREEDFVIWQGPLYAHEPVNVCFLATQYAEEVERALQDFSWETPDRTVARLVSKAVDKTTLQQNGFAFCWVSGNYKSGMMTASLMQGRQQIFVSIPWDGQSIESTARELTAVLQRPHQSWPNVE